MVRMFRKMSLRPGGLREVAVVVDVLQVAGGDRGAHDRASA